AVRTWAKAWADLGAISLGTEPYNAALQALTDQVVLRDLATGKPNGSALNQLRSNEVALALPPDLRQFNLIALPGDSLHETAVALTPDFPVNAQDPNWNHLTILDSFIVTHKTDIDANNYSLPLIISSIPFQGAAAPINGG